MSRHHLTLFPSVPVWHRAGHWVLDRKFLDGLVRYAELWQGPMRCMAWLADGSPPSHGTLHCSTGQLPCELLALPPSQQVTDSHLQHTDLLLAAGDDYRQLGLSRLCRRLHRRCAYVIEYIPETRRQIIRIETPGRLRRWRHQLFLDQVERQRIRAFGLAHGLQANGLPAYEHYAHRHGLLYFDTRMSAATLPSPQRLERRLSSLLAGRPLHLAFSGRLIGMKGAQQLLPLAHLLSDRDLPFHFSIYGAGELTGLLRQQLAQYGLEQRVTLVGPLDFASELVPRIQREVDLYVMPHPQSDPSCTYLETLACGIPIAGYLNRAFAGLLSVADIGRGAAIDDLRGLADQICALDRDRVALARLSRQALDFARHHTVETVFRQRVEHLQQLCEASP